ncbi:MAG: antitermination protein Q [Pseudomonadales bacterium GWC1_66_9]|uniref:Phage antitermination Q family protein n=1 Tax=Azotobacter chroococcum NCIMB 8003 TaxID=1328314 RepID=A0A0C4WI08_9GAMM|nr:antiterminator Q family protein [Azotobacter chroococcum]AJE21483.1 Phage antitermination Q family protein [Azotobacter chroococcum NCIMB 8003]OHC11129.1 MAG: antitermination protein Q [Pseudomonadales bacterium GWC1_66_9]
MTQRRDTEDLLQHWGMWVIQGSGVSACQASTLPTPMITDDEGLLIDGLVSRLRRGYPESADVLLHYYTSRDATFSVVGRRLGFGAEKTRQLWKAGVAWIDGVLEGICLAA